MKVLPILVSLLLLGACSQINTESRSNYAAQKPVLRHGIVPVETTGVVQLRPVNLELVNSGREVYLKYCMDCHGIEGRGGGPQAVKENLNVPNLRSTVQEVPHFDFFISFSQFQGSMPGWRSPINQQEREALVEYLKSLAQ